MKVRVHNNHIHIDENHYTFSQFKSIVTQFLGYYREGYTDISDQLIFEPLKSAWPYLPPAHLPMPKESYRLYNHRYLLYQIATDNNLFEVTLVPPQYTQEGIDELRAEFKKVCPKEWVVRCAAKSVVEVDLVKKLDADFTKENCMAFFNKRNKDCSEMPFCNPLRRMAIEKFGGPINKNDHEWHQACPVYFMCWGAKDTNNVMDKVTDAIRQNLDDPTKAKWELKESIRDLVEDRRMEDFYELQQLAANWEDN
jgi:hypothetical protein